MNRGALVLAAHGSRVDRRTNERIAELARRIRSRELFDEVSPAFHHGSPGFGAVLDALVADEVVVVPVMTSSGYYCDEALPRELARNRRRHTVRVVLTRPVGCHPEAHRLVARRASLLAARCGLKGSETALAVVGHGTARNAQSRISTERLAKSVWSGSGWAEVVVAFLDERPGVETILSQTVAKDVVVVPFLISGGPHATADIPAQLGMTPQGLPPFDERLGDRRVLVDRAFGEDPGLEGIIVDLATSAVVREAVS